MDRGQENDTDSDPEDMDQLLPTTMAHSQSSDMDTNSYQMALLKQDEATSLSWQMKKWTALVLLTFQGVVVVAVMHYTKVRPQPPGTAKYTSASVVALSETAKFIFSAVFLIFLNGFHGTLANVKDVCIHHPVDSARVAVLAVCYVISNNLILFATGHLTVGVLLVLGQTKIFATAFFTRVLLKRELKAVQWVALGFLFLGVTSTEYSRRLAAHPSTNSLEDSSGTKAEEASEQQNPAEGQDLQGVMAMMAASVVASFGGVFFEKILKSSKDGNHEKRSLWLRNLQLSAVSLPFAYFNWIWSDYQLIFSEGLFHGYVDVVIWILPLLSAVGGLIFACVIKYADNILKGFAASASILLGVCVDVAFFHQPFHSSFYFSVFIVITSVFLYSR